MNDIRIIKKYPNRRLYDTQDSRYITLQDIRQLVLDEAAFEVIDKKTGENITRCILLQVISDQEGQGKAVLSENFLAQVIRAYSGAVPDVIRNYLESTLKLFVDQQQMVADNFRATTGTDPAGAISEVAMSNMNQWLDWQKQVLNTVGNGVGVTQQRQS